MSTLTDSSFPGLATALNPQDMIELLHNALKEDQRNLEVKEAKILDVKYKPGEEGILLYEFKIKDRYKKINHKQLFTVTLLKEGENSPLPVTWEDLIQFPQRENLLISKPFFYLSDSKILLNTFPYDAFMPWLGNVLDKRFMKERLGLIWSREDIAVHEIDTHLLGYTPELRAVILYQVHFENKSTGARSRKEFIGKTSSYKEPETLFADLWALWKTCGDRVGIPRPEEYFSDPPLLLQQRVPGERLGKLVNSSSFQRLLQQTARSIALIHQTRIPLNKTRDPIRETRSLRRCSVLLQNIRSDLSRRIQTLQASLLSEIELRTSATGTVHGDFHPANVLVDGEKVYLVDFDQMACGDPSADIGRFLASFRISSLRRFGNLDSLKEAEETFFQEYLNAGSGDASKIRMFESSSLITTAATAFRVQRPGWEKEVLLLIEEAERLLEKTKSLTKVSLHSPDKHSLKFEEKKKWLLHPQYMRATLGFHLRRNYSAEIYSCNILKATQTDSAFRILFKAEGRKTEEPWTCEVEGILPKRSPKRTLFRQLVSLQEISDQTEDAFVIPRPLAYLSLIGTIIQVPLSGIPLSSLLMHSEVPVWAAKLARAFSIVHRTRISCNHILSTQDVFRRLERKIRRLKVHNPDFFRQAFKLLTEARERIPESIQENALNFRRLTPDHVFWLGDRPGVSLIQKLVVSHPCLDIGEFLAHLRLLGINQNQQKEVKKMSDALRSAYCDLDREGSDLLAEFETLAALSIASSCAKNHAQIAKQLLEYGAERLRAT